MMMAAVKGQTRGTRAIGTLAKDGAAINELAHAMY